MMRLGGEKAFFTVEQRLHQDYRAYIALVDGSTALVEGSTTLVDVSTTLVEGPTTLVEGSTALVDDSTAPNEPWFVLAEG